MSIGEVLLCAGWGIGFVCGVVTVIAIDRANPWKRWDGDFLTMPVGRIAHLYRLLSSESLPEPAPRRGRGPARK